MTVWDYDRFAANEFLGEVKLLHLIYHDEIVFLPSYLISFFSTSLELNHHLSLAHMLRDLVTHITWHCLMSHVTVTLSHVSRYWLTCVMRTCPGRRTGILYMFNTPSQKPTYNPQLLLNVSLIRFITWSNSKLNKLITWPAAGHVIINQLIISQCCVSTTKILVDWNAIFL